jgi:hypothetical protein
MLSICFLHGNLDKGMRCCFVAFSVACQITLLSKIYTVALDSCFAQLLMVTWLLLFDMVSWLSCGVATDYCVIS